MNRVTIIGGGIAGLSLAYRLRKLQPNARIRLIEASPRVGGLIRTEQRDGYLVEHGPESILRAKPQALNLARELGLESELQHTQRHVSGAYIVRDGTLRRIPEGFSLMAPGAIRPFMASDLFSWRAKARVLLEPFIATRRDQTDESLASFVRRRLGQEILDQVAQPMVSGIYGADAEALSLRASMPRFVELEEQHGSLLRGLRSQRAQNQGAAGARYNLFFSFLHGMQTLTDALAAQVGDCVRTNTPVSEIVRNKSSWEVVGPGYRDSADYIVLAMPASQASGLVRGVEPRLASKLDSIPYGRGAAVTLAFDRRVIRHPLDAYGFLVPRVEPLSILACTFSHQKWKHRAPAGYALLRVFLAGQICESSDGELLEVTMRDLSSLLSIDGAPVHSWVTRYQPSTPHYTLGHIDRVDDLFADAAKQQGLFFAGNAYRGVGIPDTIDRSESIATAISGEISHAATGQK